MSKIRRRDLALRFLAAPSRVLIDKRYRSMTAPAKAILWHIAQHWAGPKDHWNNNGNIGYGVRAVAAIGISKNRAASALKELTSVSNSTRRQVGTCASSAAISAGVELVAWSARTPTPRVSG